MGPISQVDLLPVLFERSGWSTCKSPSGDSLKMWGSLQQVCGAGMALAQGERGVAGTRLNLHLGWSGESKGL